MKLSTRLLLPLVAAVAVVMLGYAIWSLRQRERIAVAEAERETRAYAIALGLALERAVGRSEPDGVEEMIARIDREPSIYAVIVYDTTATPLFVSSPLAELASAPQAEVRAVLAGGSARTLRREVEGEPAVAVLRPLLDESGAVRAALEVVQPLTSVTSQLAGTRVRFLLNTLTLILAMTLLLTALVRRYLSEPLDRFVEAVRALGGGELSHRLEPATAVGELATVAAELNRMADRLEETRHELVVKAEERVTLERELRHSEKLAEVGRLAAGLAHEIGAPLHVIRGRADLVLRSDPGPAGRERNLGIIVQQIDRITLIVRNLLGYARRREPRPAEVELVGLATGVADFLETEAARAETRIDVEGAAPLVVRADPDLLHQLLLNLVLNAIHAVEDTEGARRIAIRVRAVETGMARIDVEDSGSGIAEDLRERVFDPFFTTKDEGRGTGLGLALARAIVADHGGSIAVVPPSGPGWSTRVRVELPGARAPAPELDPGRASA